MKEDLKSSVSRQGKLVTQIITAVTGVKKTFRGIKTETIEQGQMTKFELEDGRFVLINDQNVFCIEVFATWDEEQRQKKELKLAKNSNDKVGSMATESY